MQNKNTNLLRGIEEFIFHFAPDIQKFWKSGEDTTWEAESFLAHADYIYSFFLLYDDPRISSESVRYFANAVTRAPLAGRDGYKKTFSPHLSAYILGALNLLSAKGFDYRASVLGAIDLNLDTIIDPDTKLPRWPRLWSHHIWRVSHWLGGIPSILLSFARHAPQKKISENFIISVLKACDGILDDSTGLMLPYRNVFLQKFFRTAYQLRHDPNHGDIGGVAHIHWINHALGRPYKATQALIERCLFDMKKSPFMEESPYCLDFDYMQLLRTASEQQQKEISQEIKNKAKDYISAILKFLSNIPINGYTLHKLPGTLATLHEASLILNYDIVPCLCCTPVDVIQFSYWL